MAKAPGDGWELLLSGQLPKSAPDSCAPHLTPGESTAPGGWVWPLAAASPQVLVSGEHLTAEAPGNGMAPRFITPRTCFFIYMYIYLFFFVLLCWILVAAQAFSRCGERRLFSVVVHGLLTAAASLVAEHGR